LIAYGLLFFVTTLSLFFSSFYLDNLHGVALFSTLFFLSMDEHNLLSDFTEVGVFHDFTNLFNHGFITVRRANLMADDTSGGLELFNDLSVFGEGEDRYRRSVLSDESCESAGLGVADDEVNWEVEDGVD